MITGAGGLSDSPDHKFRVHSLEFDHAVFRGLLGPEHLLEHRHVGHAGQGSDLVLVHAVFTRGLLNQVRQTDLLVHVSGCQTLGLGRVLIFVPARHGVS